jgi:hypothetical protein
VTLTKYDAPEVTVGTRADIVVDPETVTPVAWRMTLAELGVAPVSWTKFTVVPLTNPVPMIAIVVLPVTAPDGGLMLVMVGSCGAHSQLSIVRPVPQYVAHTPLLGELTPGG